MRHARSLGDVWVDTVANVGAYWRGQQILAAAPSSASGASTTWTWSLPPHFPPGNRCASRRATAARWRRTAGHWRAARRATTRLRSTPAR